MLVTSFLHYCMTVLSTVKELLHGYKLFPFEVYAYSEGRQYNFEKNINLANILKILPPKNENFQMKKSDMFHISVQKIDCGFSLEPPRRGGSNEYPQSMFLSRNKKKTYCIL